MNSKIQTRKAFGQYLHCVLYRLSGQKTKFKMRIDDSDCELILRFLQRANHNLRTAYHLKVSVVDGVHSRSRGCVHVSFKRVQ